MSIPKLEGKIRVGEVFEWCYYGHEGWPHSYARIRVTRICAWGDDTLLETEDDHDDDETGAAIEALHIPNGINRWTPLDRFREMCRRAPVGEAT